MVETHDYWHRRVALMSVSGISKLLLTFVTLIWIAASLLPFMRSLNVNDCLVHSSRYTYVHLWVQLGFGILIGFLILILLLAKGIPGLCLGLCPRTFVRCKKSCA